MTRHWNRFTRVLLLAACLTGCTTRAWYDGMQNSAKSACQQQPSSEQARCEARLNRQDFDAYEKSRAGSQNKIIQ